jgi:ubiquinone/menaquinone biosynthesis C-methylase UbiE
VNPIGTAEIRKGQRYLFDSIVRRCPNLGLDRRAEKFVTLFEHYLPRKSFILDIGGSWGFYAEPLALCGHHVTILDVVKPQFQKAPVVIYRGNHIPFRDKRFDASLLITVLHHMADPEAVIREAQRVTRKTVIVIEDLYHHALGRWWTVLRDRIYNFEFFGHPCRFKKAEEWVALFERLGFSLVEEKQMYTWLARLRILNGLFVFQVKEKM